MMTSFISTTAASQSNAVAPAKAGAQVKKIRKWIPAFAGMTSLLFVANLFSFEVDTPVVPQYQDFNEILRVGEAGDLKKEETLPGVWHLFHQDYENARNAVRTSPASYPQWFDNYVKALPELTSKMSVQSSEHFDLYTPKGQEFLGFYALPALEKAGDYFEKVWGMRPAGRVRVDIYPNKEEFSRASTLTPQTLESSGAIGICKFHRLMILTPQALPIGYRWLDALTHEYTHLMINTLSGSKAELWIHEGIARYFETAPRLKSPLFLTPQQKTELKQAQIDNKLIAFSRMSPSMVYLKDQSEVSLAFSEVAYSVSNLVDSKGEKHLGKFLKSLRDRSFPDAFLKNFGKNPDQFETEMHKRLGDEKWVMTKGALPDEVRFTPIDESEAVGADAQAEMRLGDKMRMRGRPEAALVEYENALVQEPDNAVLLLKAARASSEIGHKKEAREYLERAVEKNPNYITPYMDLAPLVEAPRAEKLYNEANALNPFDPRIHEALAKLSKDEKVRKQEDEIARQLRAQAP